MIGITPCHLILCYKFHKAISTEGVVGDRNVKGLW
jgi:hypothetical protein